MLRLYSLVWWLALPLVLLRLWLRGRQESGYRAHWAERLSWYPAVAPLPRLWVHAVSVGETRAAEPLILALLAAHPEHQLLLTHMTPTGRATGAHLFGHLSRVQQCYLPYDTGTMAGRFVRHFRPVLCVLMETEVWPNLVAQCLRYQVPVALVNARLSARSLKKGQRLQRLMTPAVRGLRCVAAQTESDAQRLRAFGAASVVVTGSVKFDITPPPLMLASGAVLREQIGRRPVFLCASTREGEEALILAAFAALQLPEALLLLVPRHPQRFDQVYAMVAAHGYQAARRSTLGAQALPVSVQVLLGDTMGEMFAYYAACDLAFIGGSLLPLGGQNLIEACATAKPVLVGPHTFNFAEVTEDAIAAGAALRVHDARELMHMAGELLRSAPQCHSMATSGLQFAQQHRGATARTLVLLNGLFEA